MDAAEEKKFREQLAKFKRDLGIVDDKTKLTDKTTIKEDGTKTKAKTPVFKSSISKIDKTIKETKKVVKEIKKTPSAKTEKNISKTASKAKASISDPVKKEASKVSKDVGNTAKVEIKKTEPVKVVKGNTQQKVTDHEKKPLIISKEEPVKKAQNIFNKIDDSKKTLSTSAPISSTEIPKPAQQEIKKDPVIVRKQEQKTTENRDFKKTEKPVESTTKFQKSEDIETELSHEVEKKGLNFLFYLIPLLLLLGIGVLIYFNLQEKEGVLSDIDSENNVAIIDSTENLISDSIVDNIEETPKSNNKVTLISDTLLNISIDKPQGYYAVIGSYQTDKYAVKAQNHNATRFDSYILKSDQKIRVGLFLGKNETEINDNLKSVKRKYNAAWLLYNNY